MKPSFENLSESLFTVFFSTLPTFSTVPHRNSMNIKHYGEIIQAALRAETINLPLCVVFTVLLFAINLMKYLCNCSAKTNL